MTTREKLITILLLAFNPLTVIVLLVWVAYLVGWWSISAGGPCR